MAHRVWANQLKRSLLWKKILRHPGWPAYAGHDNYDLIDDS